MAALLLRSPRDGGLEQGRAGGSKALPLPFPLRPPRDVPVADVELGLRSTQDPPPAPSFLALPSTPPPSGSCREAADRRLRAWLRLLRLPTADAADYSGKI
jgi:hypothetical protein